MPVDAEIQKLLDVINKLPTFDYAAQPAVEIARQMRAGPVTIPPVPQPVRVESRNVLIPGADIPVRIYRPDGPGPFGVMVSFHGGGWVTGKLDSDEYKSHVLVRSSGCAIVSVDYRMAPEYRFPVGAEDCYAVTEWVAKNAAMLGFDPARIGVGGSSAGGNLSAVVPLMARDRGGPALKWQLLTYPVIDDDFTRPSYRDNPKGKVISHEQMAWFWEQYAPGKAERNNPYLNPLRAKDLRGLPPALVITAEFDPLRDEGEAYAKKLKEAGVEVQYTRYDGMVHGFLSMAVLHPASQKALAETSAAMKKYLGPR